MNILVYLLVPVLVVAIAASVTWARNRQPTSLQSGVDSFRREMDALSPDADPMRRRDAGSSSGGQGMGGEPERGPSAGPAAGPNAGPPRRPRDVGEGR